MEFGQGFGRDFYTKVEEMMEEKNVDRIEGKVALNTSEGFWKKMGYDELGPDSTGQYILIRKNIKGDGT